MVEDEARAEVVVAPHLRLLAEDHLDVAERGHVFREPPAGDRRTVDPVVAGLGVAPVDEAIVGEIGVERHVEETALPARHDLRHPGNRS